MSSLNSLSAKVPFGASSSRRSSRTASASVSIAFRPRSLSGRPGPGPGQGQGAADLRLNSLSAKVPFGARDRRTGLPDARRLVSIAFRPRSLSGPYESARRDFVDVLASQ